MESLRPALLLLPALALLSDRAEAQACLPFPFCRTLYDSANPTLAAATPNVLTTVNCPFLGNPFFHIHMQPVPPGAPAFFFYSVAAADFPLPIGPTIYPVLVDPALLFLVHSSVVQPDGHAEGALPIPNEPILLGTFVASQGAFAAGGTVVLTNGVSFTICL